MALEYYTLLPDLDLLKKSYRTYIEDFKEVQPLPALNNAVLQGNRQTLRHDPLSEIMAWGDNKTGQYEDLSEDKDEQ